MNILLECGIAIYIFEQKHIGKNGVIFNVMIVCSFMKTFNLSQSAHTRLIRCKGYKIQYRHKKYLN